ncbi:helix-turn-helix transcriptional regulator [Enterobacter hormaechei]|uniref:helix-turn-helix transcriptional regulator n=1 Tax=Enterobacter hormaechei TaxID=158836 RepID=UPI0032DB607B
MSPPQGGSKAVLISGCGFSRLALEELLSSGTVDAVSSTVQARQVCQSGTTGVVVHLQGGLKGIVAELCGLVALLEGLPSACPVVLLTEMSRSCALALLMLAHMPEAQLARVRVVRDRLSPGRIRGLLQDALRGERTVCGLFPAAKALKPAELRVLRALLYGIPVYRQTRVYGLSVKTLYARLYSALRRMRVNGKHALLCGDFYRQDCRQ